MMTIDNKNIWTEYSCMLLENSLSSILQYPKRTTVKYNNWAESDGIDPDLTTVDFDAKYVKLNFYMESAGELDFWAKYNKFINAISAPGYRSVKPIEGLTLNMRYNASSSYTMIYGLNDVSNPSYFTLEFVIDKPDLQSITSVIGGISLRGQASINDVDFGAYGIGVDESMNDIFAFPSVKQPFSDGRMIYLDSIFKKHQEINIPLWIIADSEQEFINNYQAFFTQLKSTGTVKISFHELKKTIQAYYTDCTNFVVDIWSPEKIAAHFNLKMTIPEL